MPALVRAPRAARVDPATSASARRRAASSAESRERRHPARVAIGALAATVVALTSTAPAGVALEANETNSEFVERLRARSEEKREERKQERLDDYYKKNFGDYLRWESGDKALRDPSALSENDRKIAAYLEKIS